MWGEQWLKKPRQYTLVYNEGRSWVSSLVVMKTLPNGLALSRCGFSISRRIGKAVVRNRVKRLLREILRLATLEPGWDVILVARLAAANAGYADLDKSVRGLLLQAGLLKIDEEECS